MNKWFHRYAVFTVFFTAFLVWWGAAVTTENVGMAVPDWPLSYGTFNPEGWWKVWPILLEHGHRELAKIVGYLTIGLFAWAYVRSWKRFLEPVALVAVLVGVVVALGVGAEWKRQMNPAATGMFALAAALGAVPVGWLVYHLKRRDTGLLVKLTALALFLVSLQAILGGLRVTEISNAFAVVHGCVAQTFFCVLVMIAMVSSRRWEAYRRALIPARLLSGARAWSIALVAAVFGQLILGATMRHTHCLGLADEEGLLTTGGAIFPGFGDFDLAVLFSHKAGAVVVLMVATMMSVFASRKLRDYPGLRRHSYAVTALVLAQLVLGGLVIVTVKGFWVTNFHVVTGLLILALSFGFAVRCFTAERSAAAAEQTRAAAALDKSRNGRELPAT